MAPRKSNLSQQIVALRQRLNALVLQMSEAQSPQEVRDGQERLSEFRGELPKPGPRADRETAALLRETEAQIAWLEEQLEKLRLVLERKRRVQEDYLVAQAPKQEEPLPDLLALSADLTAALVAAVGDAKEAIFTAPQDREQADKAAPEKEAEEKPEAREKEGPREEKAEAGPEAREDPARLSSPKRLVAHMAASVKEDPDYFRKLTQQAKRPGPSLAPGPEDPERDVLDRASRDLNRRLVNLELHVKAIADAQERREPVYSLVRAAAKDVKSFFRELREHKTAHPNLAGEFDRLFGGYAETFAATKPELGQEILSNYLEEKAARSQQREAQPEARRPVNEAPRAEAGEREAPQQEAPQLVLRRDDWNPPAG